ncbi:hypothetical protein JT06_18520 [Desulfobulbus sp. Tol-SR]|jgi:hypothetical protein|nr:hypothetical protein JT06_18520 [Desulfobulbus sp. Tol-SR]
MSRQEVRTLRVVTEKLETAAGAMPTLAGVNATAAEINYAADLSAQDAMAPGAGFAGTGTVYESAVERGGGIIKTRILIDLTGTKSTTTDLDIIGLSGVSHIGQVTTAINGTIVGGSLTCLEAPATGVTDIDLYAATEGTGAYDGAVGDLAETALVTAGGAWTLGLTKPLLVPVAADKYLYLTCGAAGVVGTYTAGVFLLEMWGV